MDAVLTIRTKSPEGETRLSYPAEYRMNGGISRVICRAEEGVTEIYDLFWDEHGEPLRFRRSGAAVMSFVPGKTTEGKLHTPAGTFPLTVTTTRLAGHRGGNGERIGAEYLLTVGGEERGNFRVELELRH